MSYSPPSRPPEELVAKRFQGTEEASRTVAESAVEMSERYAAVTEKASALQAENQTLSKANQSLEKKVAMLEAELKQTQAELSEANGLLMEVLSELNTWKSDVLGFRSEMRQAAKAELEALLKILEILGAEVSETTAAGLTEESSQP